MWEEFIDQQKEMGLPTENVTMTYEGYGVNISGLWIDNGEVKINNVCF